jgi:dUTP pyrophosphatase
MVRYTLKIFTPNPQLRELYEARKHDSICRGDSGVDLFCATTQTIPEDSLSNKIDLNIICELLLDGKPAKHGYLLLPRSSIIKTPLRLANSMGVIDAGYRGHIIACVDNHTADQNVLIQTGDRLFQICVPSFEPINVEMVDTLEELSSTIRGDGGFGSTGK